MEIMLHGDQGFAESAMEVEVLVPSNRICNEGEGRVANQAAMETRVSLNLHWRWRFWCHPTNLPSDRICNGGGGFGAIRRICHPMESALKVRVESQFKVLRRDLAMVHRKIRIIFWFARDEFNLSKAKIGYSSAKRVKAQSCDVVRGGLQMVEAAKCV